MGNYPFTGHGAPKETAASAARVDRTDVIDGSCPAGKGSANEELENRSLMLSHSKLENMIRYLGIEMDSALELSEQTKV